MPRSEDLLNNLKVCKDFSISDLKPVYQHNSIKETDRLKIAFVNHDEK